MFVLKMGLNGKYCSMLYSNQHKIECVNGPQMGGDEGGGGEGGGDRVHALARAGRASALAAIRAGLEEKGGRTPSKMTKLVVDNILKRF